MVLLGGSKSELVMQKICFRPVTDRLGWTNLSRHIYEHLGHFKKNKHQQKPNEYVYDVLSLSLSLSSHELDFKSNLQKSIKFKLKSEIATLPESEFMSYGLSLLSLISFPSQHAHPTPRAPHKGKRILKLKGTNLGGPKDTSRT